MFDNELQYEADSKKALDKYGPSGLAGSLNQNNLQISNGIFKMPHTFNGFGVTGYKDGGIVKGPGTGTSDSIPAKLPVASAIIPAHIVKLYGKDYFDKLEAAAPKSGDTKGKVDAKISNGEYQLSPAAVKYWGQDFITKLIGSDNESSETNDSPSEEAAEMQHYREGGVVDQPPSLRDRALNTADSNAEFRQRNPDFGAKFAQSNAPAQPQPSLRERLGMPVTQPQAPEPSLRERLGMPPRTEPIQRAPLGRPVAPNAPVVGGIRGAFNGAMQGLGSSPALATGLASTVLSDPAVAAGRDNAIAGLKQKAGIPADDTPYKFAKGGIVKPCYADGTASVGQEYADAGIPVLDNIANKVKGLGQGTINTVMAPLNAVRNASNVDPNAMRIQPKKVDIPDNQGFGAKPNATPQPVAQSELAAEQAKGLAKVATNPQPAPNPTLTPQNQYDSALIPDGNRLQLTPEYNAQLNAKDQRTVAQRDASNATPEQPAQGGFGARANDDYLTQRGKILAQNMEYNNQLAAMQANLAANGQPITHPAFTDTTVDPERNFGAKERLDYAKLAQIDKQSNLENSLGRDKLAWEREQAKLGANKTKYQAVKDAEGNTVRMVPESGNEADQAYAQQKQDDARTQNALLWYTDPNASEAHINAAKAWLASKNIALPKI